ncbi:MAG: hypothetical protein HYZ50_23100 [Deltaproteobacteria bacterium]|nr:hypothetical protein [Deltaproteobacteria bacterium]
MALFKSLRHNRVHYYEHDVSAGVGPYASSKTLYFSVIAEFDVEAGTEDDAGETAEDVLETLATDDVQLIAFGLVQGERRARPATEPPPPRKEVAVALEPEVEPPVQAESAEPVALAESAEPAEAEDRRGKKRGSRGRGRKRKDESETESIAARNIEEAEPSRNEEAQVAEVAPRRIEEAETAEETAPVIVRPAPVIAGIEGIETTPLVVMPLLVEDESPPLPPPRSSTAMRVKLALSFRAAELGLPANGFGFHDREELLSRGIAEARTRHPELPPDVAPEHAVVVQPWGEVMLTLTWEYDVPVPSAAEER